MALSWNEIKTRAAAFVNDWHGETYERGEAQTFWNEFFHIFGLSRRRLASYEKAVKKLDGRQGFIDLLWPGMLLVEHKSLGKDLDDAQTQALDYFPGLTDAELPRYILVSDFARFLLSDLEEGTHASFTLDDLLSEISRFGFIAGYEKRTYKEQDPVNVEAAERMGALHDRLKDAGYRGHDLEVYLVRLLFCLFADDTGIFSPRGVFEALVLDRTREDGSDLAGWLSSLFDTLNTPEEERMRTLDEALTAFPYVNGALFAERLRPAAFDASMRRLLLSACSLDWGNISPAIFGSMFQSVMDPSARRALGAHYTSETNILKLLGPLFLDDLHAELGRLKLRGSRTDLARFHEKLAALRLLDPACGCGNFLVVAYRELRRLEIETVRELYRADLEAGQRVINIADLLKVQVGQLFGIEIEEFPAQIAQVALWLADHQMNLEVAAAFGEYFTRLPLRQSPHVLNGNALRLDWETAFGEAQPEAFDYILGNPPFGGKKEQLPGPKADLTAVLSRIPASGVLDFVTGWFIKAAEYMSAHRSTHTAFVATNSVSQGEQVGILWNELFHRYGAKLHFAHRTFRWTNEARGRAAVHVVIEGFALFDAPVKTLFEYNDVRGEPHARTVSNINPYLVEGSDVVVLGRRQPLSDRAPAMAYGSMPIDGGNLILSQDEALELVSTTPEVGPYVRRYVGGNEILNENVRFCLWLLECPPNVIRSVDGIRSRVEANRAYRQSSGRAATRKLAATPAFFGEIRQPKTKYLAVPKVSSETRTYIPLVMLDPSVIASGSALIVADATLFHLGILSSTLHMAWMRYVAGRLESRYQYSAGIVYNTFPWPEPAEAQREAVAEAAQRVLDARAPFLETGHTLADLYDPLAMPPVLSRAHADLDRAVDRAYRPQPFTTELNRVSFLFERYERLTAGLFARPKKAR